VALWREDETASLEPVFPPGGGPPQPQATDVRYDFLQLLLDKVNRGKKLYKVAVVQEEFDFEAPADEDQIPDNGDIADVPGIPEVNDAELNGRLTMRDVILVRKPQRKEKTKIKVSNPTGGNFDNLLEVNVGGVVTVPVTRGWTAVDAVATKKRKGKDVKKRFHFVNSHFEAFDDETEVPSIRALQAQEMSSIAVDPAYGGDRPVILLGDFNSDIRTEVQEGDAQAYQVLRDAGFSERSTFEPLSCCVGDLFTSPPSEFDHQVDHIMTDASRSKVKLLSSSVTGRKQVGGIYPSDHAGVFSKLRLK
jgi:hypothetical protein